MKDAVNPLLQSSLSIAEETLFGMKTAYRIVRDAKPELLENTQNNQELLSCIEEWLFSRTDETEDIKLECLLQDEHLFDAIDGLKIMINKHGKNGVDSYIQQQKESFAAKLKAKE